MMSAAGKVIMRSVRVCTWKLRKFIRVCD